MAVGVIARSRLVRSFLPTKAVALWPGLNERAMPGPVPRQSTTMIDIRKRIFGVSVFTGSRTSERKGTPGMGLETGWSSGSFVAIHIAFLCFPGTRIQSQRSRGWKTGRVGSVSGLALSMGAGQNRTTPYR